MEKKLGRELSRAEKAEIRYMLDQSESTREFFSKMLDQDDEDLK